MAHGSLKGRMSAERKKVNRFERDFESIRVNSMKISIFGCFFTYKSSNFIWLGLKELTGLGNGLDLEGEEEGDVKSDTHVSAFNNSIWKFPLPRWGSWRNDRDWGYGLE